MGKVYFSVLSNQTTEMREEITLEYEWGKSVK